MENSRPISASSTLAFSVSTAITFTLSIDLRSCRSYTIVDFPLARVSSNDDGWVPDEFNLSSHNWDSQQHPGQRDG
ncbi:uncharacterized protein HD556DRAFT_1442639 [Suillus plorans]|uniref:Uncharacterized protein n=1 Tax=Suillus plorans TaxID=116603 RepID=A0A9P7ARA2_9AGAM|nr:uncharacterized protein HD556DRAFT_1442639 [Suillus plorans]KAG1794851.1 hypothetical protein HD556DRAFT_1442639 [Suillus plorans]